jgi:hypothetical protein
VDLDRPAASRIESASDKARRGGLSGPSTKH